MGEHCHQELTQDDADEKKLIYHCYHPVIKKNNNKTTQSKGFFTYILVISIASQGCSFERIAELCWSEKVVSTHSSVKSQHVSLSTPQQRLNEELGSLRFRHIHMPKPQHGWLLQLPSLQVVVLPPPSWQQAEIFLSPAPKTFANSKCRIFTAGTTAHLLLYSSSSEDHTKSERCF